MADQAKSDRDGSQRTGSRRPAKWVSALASVMDTKYAIPGTGIRFGLDPIIGLIPVAGDTVTLLIGAAMLLESRRLGLGWGVAGRIGANLGIDWLVGLVPGLDLVFDTMFKAHKRNAELIMRKADEKYGESGDRPAAKRVVNEAGEAASAGGHA
jgi:hypothetical protein